MQLRTRTWFAISLCCFLAAYFFWHLAERLERKNAAKAGRESAPTATQSAGANSSSQAPAAPVATATNAASSNPAPVPAAASGTNAAVRKEPFPYRLSNTPRKVDDLARSDAAVLLRNALIDSSAPVNLAIPPHLRAAGDPGAYVVQSRGPLTDGFRARLGQAGAQIVSYVPNNAYLVRATAGAAQQLAALPETLSVLPWEPYYKLEPKLLELAVEKKPLPADARLNVVVFADAGDAVRQALALAGVAILGEERTPFGPMLAVKPAAETLPMLAALPGVQAIERRLPRKTANDLSRSRIKASGNVGPASDPDSANYRGLTGIGVKVNVNDTGVDTNQPALAGRVTGDSPFVTQDFDGHGTHVAGIIAGNGAGGPDGKNVQGSFENSNYRGMAPEAEIFAMPIDLTFGPFQSEEYLQETAAANNADISNNSWGYPGADDYTFASASWDSATRDALPGVPGSQPLTLVFAAGNSGLGDDDGLGGLPGSVHAPGTAKNVITVGAAESYRNITNSFEVVTEDNGEMVTNIFQPFLRITDSSNQITGFSSRGNVAPGIEGEMGRFKPDVVAPGAMIVSTRSCQAALPDSLTNVLVNNVFNQTLLRGQTNLYAVFVPNDGFRLVIQVLSNSLSPSPMPPLLIRVQAGALPDEGSRLYVNSADQAVAPGIYFYSIANTNRIDVRFDIRTYVVVNVEPPTGYFEVLRQLNDSVGPNYRFESGTSQAAPAVTGLIALMREFFDGTFQRTNSPALTKALLINGARTLADDYDFQIDPTVNIQGWGLVNLTNSIPEGPASIVSGESSTATGRLIFLDQSPDRALVSGQSVTRNLDVPLLAQDFPLRITLAWTDPPGNPTVGTKLVNDLDLIVTNLSNGEVFEGNHFGNGATFTSGTASNTVPLPDIINNVENVYLNRGLSGRYSVTVRARRVNVNAVTENLTSIVQDYALVISTERPEGGLSLETPMPAMNPAPRLTFATNGAALLNQRVGANSPLIVSTNGATNQWHFFVVTNELPASDPNYGIGGEPRYMAFTTFLPPNLSIPRSSEEADIDLYVSDNPAITNLDTGVLNEALKSRKRGGTESVVINGAIPGRVYYAGVKSEDQQAANFGFFAISSSLPFSSEDMEGNVTALGFPRFIQIPDGSARRPEAALVFAFVTQPVTVESVIVTNGMSHDSGGDLLGNLSHNQGFAVLNNHRAFRGNNLQWIYDDSESDDIPGSQPVDGPGTLNSFVGQEGVGVWQLAMIDNTPFHTGQVNFLSITLTPQMEDLFNDTGVNGTIRARRFARSIYTVNVPAQATNLSVCVKPDNGPVDVYIRRGAVPTLTEYDAFGSVPVEGGCVSIGRSDSPPLSAGRYFIRLFNPNFFTITYNVKIQVDLDLNRSDAFTFRSGQAQQILDNAVTTSTITVNQSRQIAEMSIGVRIDHPRVSDLVMHVVSPNGTRLLLAENRGGPAGADYGAGLQQTNTFPVQTAGGAAANTNVLAVTDTEGTIEIQYQFFTVGDTLRVYYEGNLLFDSKLTSGAGVFSVDYGPGLSTNIFIVVNEGNNPNGTTAWEYTATVLSGYQYATFTENTGLAPELIKFALPPFAPATTPPVSNFITGFETVAPGVYSQGDMFDNWTVTSNKVEVVTGMADDVYEGVNVLTLANGILTRNLPTTPGKSYQLRYFTRDPGCLVSWWPGEITRPFDATDVTGTNSGLIVNGTANYTNNFTNGIVGKAFIFDGTNTYISIPPSASLNVGYITNLSTVTNVGIVTNNGFTVECWVKPDGGVTDRPIAEWNNGTTPGVHFWIGGTGGLPGGGGPGALYANIVDTGGTNHLISTAPGLVSDTGTNFQHIALSYDREAGIARLYYNGLPVASNVFAPFIPQTSYPFYLGYRPAGTLAGARYRGLLDEVSVYRCALTDAEIYGIFASGGNGKCGPTPDCSPTAQLTINGITSPVYGTSIWTATSVPFTAVSNQTLMKLQGSPLSLDFDSFELTEYAGGGLYLAEEPLTPFFGENAAGDWKLEVWDNRVNAAVTNASLLAWKLNIVFVNTNPAAITLTNGVAFCGTLGTNETAFFRVVTPVESKGITNTMVAQGNMTLSYNQSGLPSGQQPPDTIFQRDVPDGISVIATNGWQSYDLNRNLRDSATSPKLLAGRVYYLALQNRTSSSNSYCVQVDFDVAGTIVNLADNVPICGSLGPSLPPSTNSAQYFVFLVSTGAVQATFQTFNASSNVDLFLQYGANFTNIASLLSLTTNYPYASTNRGVTNEIIRLTTNSRPFALTNGPWFMAVVNRDRTNANYCIVANQVLASEIVGLTNALPYARTNFDSGIGPAVPIDYFHFPVSAGSRRAQFELLEPSADVTLVLKKGLPLPDLLNATEISARGGTSDELIYLLDYSTPVPLTAGDWFLGVVNATGNEAGYRAQVTEFPVYGTNFGFDFSQVITGALCLTWTNTLTNVNYHVLGANVVNPPYWVPLEPGIRATTNQLTWCTPSPSPYSVFRLAEGLVPTLYPALKNLDGTPVPTNGFTVRWSAPADQRFLLEGSELLTPFSWQALTNNFRSTNGLFQYFDGPQTNGVRPYRFYRFFQLP